MLEASAVCRFVAAGRPAMVAELTAVRGSSPREAGAFMLIDATSTLGTIGGGALEYLVTARARQALRDADPDLGLEVPLGPEIGQCCGGRVSVSLRRVDAAEAGRLVKRLRDEEASRPLVIIFGAGHVGQALARALLPLPVKVKAIDTRPDELALLPDGVARQVLAMPEAAVRSAPAGSAFVILTHDHALDFLIGAEALSRRDAAYVGMVGSRTKRARFSSFYAGRGGDPERLRRLRLPIGAAGVGDKRPEVIAALTAAEILVALQRAHAPRLLVEAE